jgi:tRNA A37 threonylcarbamoyladenosine synthetase subunit TsaC/SUA5/YrdC
MPQVFNWQALSAQPAIMVEACVRTLKAGQLVGYPTESAYFLVADPASKSGMARLTQALGENPRYPILEAQPVPERPEKLIEGAGPLARRYARRVWPGVAGVSRGWSADGRR